MSHYDNNHDKSPWRNAIAWLNLDEGTGTTCADSTGHGHTLTLTGAPSWTATDLGPPYARFSTGAHPVFNGTSQYGTFATLFDVVPDAWSISIRVSFVVVAAKRILSKYTKNTADVGGAQGIDLYLSPSDFFIVCGISFGATSVSLYSGVTPIAGSVYNVTVQYGKTTGYQLIVDGVIEAQSAVLTKIANGTANPLTLGAQKVDATTGGYANAAISRFRYLPNFLNVQQIQALTLDEPTYPQLVAEDRATAHGVVMSPTADDQDSLQEVNVLVNSAGLFEALVHKGWDATADAYRYYSSPDGLTWTSGAVVLGAGTGGEASTTPGRGSIVLKDGTYYKFYDTLTGGIKYATATAMSGPWASQGVILSNAAVSAYGTRVVGPAVIWDEDRSLWVVIATVFDGVGVWRAILLTGETLGTLAINTTAGLLTDLQVGVGMYGGYWGGKLRDGRYCLLYHTASSGNVPTVGRAATSRDGTTWAQYPRPIRQLRGEFTGDQVADLYAVEYGGTLYVYYSLTDNPGNAARIAVITFEGTLDDFLIDGPLIDARTGLLISAPVYPGTVTTSNPAILRNVVVSEETS